MDIARDFEIKRNGGEPPVDEETKDMGASIDADEEFFGSVDNSNP